MNAIDIVVVLKLLWVGRFRSEPPRKVERVIRSGFEVFHPLQNLLNPHRNEIYPTTGHEQTVRLPMFGMPLRFGFRPSEIMEDWVKGVCRSMMLEQKFSPDTVRKVSAKLRELNRAD